MTTTISNSTASIVFTDEGTFSVSDLVSLGFQILDQYLGCDYRNTSIALNAGNTKQGVSVFLAAMASEMLVQLLPDELVESTKLSELEFAPGIGSLLIVKKSSIRLFDSFGPVHESTSCDHVSSSVIMATSGSPGTPKLIYHSLDSLALGALNIQSAYQIHSNDIVLGVLPITHMNGLVTTLLAPIFTNSTVVFYQGPFNADRFSSIIDYYDVTWFSSTPFHLSQLVSTLCKDHIKHNSLRFVRSASSPLSEQLRVQCRASWCSCAEFYGYD